MLLGGYSNVFLLLDRGSDASRNAEVIHFHATPQTFMSASIFRSISIWRQSTTSTSLDAEHGPQRTNKLKFDGQINRPTVRLTKRRIDQSTNRQTDRHKTAFAKSESLPNSAAAPAATQVAFVQLHPKARRISAT